MRKLGSARMKPGRTRASLCWLATGAVGGGTVGGAWQCPFGGPEGGSCSQQLYVEESCPPTPTSPRCFHIFLMFITTFEGCHEIWGPKTHRAVEVYMSFWAKEKRGRGPGFQRKSVQFTG